MEKKEKKKKKKKKKRRTKFNLAQKKVLSINKFDRPKFKLQLQLQNPLRSCCTKAISIEIQSPREILIRIKKRKEIVFSPSLPKKKNYSENSSCHRQRWVS